MYPYRNANKNLYYSLPSKHNMGHLLPDELPADLLRTPLVWVCCCGAVLLLQQPLCRALTKAMLLHPTKGDSKRDLHQLSKALHG
jgi:hypothetical protein